MRSYSIFKGVLILGVLLPSDLESHFNQTTYCVGGQDIRFSLNLHTIAVTLSLWFLLAQQITFAGLWLSTLE